jgi:FAD-dependent urate hydroxylase
MTKAIDALQRELQQELKLLEYPPKPWLAGSKEGIYDVAIIGGGMAGLAAAFGLMKEGIFNICVLDSRPEGYEGPWATTARMLTLRSPKNLVGPALGISKLTFQAWYTYQYGEKAWENLYKIPTLMWMEYLRWYRKVLQIPVQNNKRVKRIEPVDGLIQLSLENSQKVTARKIILANGREGFGGPAIPNSIMHLPKAYYAHTSDEIDFTALKGKNIAIVGVGASGFDAAACALEHGAAQVNVLVRRKKIPNINKFASATYPGFAEGFYQLPDNAKVKFIKHVFEVGMPPPFESLDRVKKYPNFRICTDTHIEKADVDKDEIILTTNQGVLNFDYLILATGFAIHGKNQPELSPIFDSILLWKDRHPDLPRYLQEYPYLGNHFEFMEKVPGKAPYLKNMYCFNYAAILSHGLTSGDIPNISTGAEGLAKGIVIDFFTDDWKSYYKMFEEFVTQEFLAEEYPFI